MNGYIDPYNPWPQQQSNYWQPGYVDPLQMGRGMPEMMSGGISMGPPGSTMPSAMPAPTNAPVGPYGSVNGNSYQSGAGGGFGVTPGAPAAAGFGQQTMQNIMNPGMGNIAMAALPMIQGDFSPESIGQGAGSYLGGAAGGAAAGALSGTAAGAAMGSVLPGIGTVIGAGLGSVAGGEIGGLFGDSKAEKEEKKQKKKAQYQWLGDAISRFSGEISMRGQERRSAIDSINQYISGGNAQRAQMRPY